MATAMSTSCRRQVVELALSARESRERPDFLKRALDAFGALVSFDSAVFTDAEPGQPLTTVGVEPCALKFVKLCEQNFASYMPEIAPVFDAARRERGALDHEVFSADFRQKSRFYAEIVRPQRVDSVLFMLPRWQSRTLGQLRFERHSPTRFRRDDLAKALDLLPMFELALAALSVDPPSAESFAPLSPRESDIAVHVARGLTNPQIAALLGTSKFTIRNQISRIFDKTRVASRSELAAWMARRNAR